jgi:CBS domain-containing protein
MIGSLFANPGQRRERAMLKARDMMTKDVVTATPDMEITQAARLLLEHHFNGLPVVNDKGKLIGIICQNDLIVQQKKFPLPSLFTFFDGLIPLTSYRSLEKEVDKIVASKVSQAMTPDPITIDPETSLEDIATLMVNNNVHTLPVVEGTRLVGIIGKEDVLRTLMPSGSQD